VNGGGVAAVNVLLARGRVNESRERVVRPSRSVWTEAAEAGIHAVLRGGSAHESEVGSEVREVREDRRNVAVGEA